MVTRDEIMKKLGQVTDPELGINIVDLGLVYSVEVQAPAGKGGGTQKAVVRMTFTTPACPMIGVMLDDVKAKLDEFQGVDIEVVVVFEPPWTPERMSERAKIRLGLV
jgi:metal-sulfur cluster biosynthetic enzyme